MPVGLTLRIFVAPRSSMFKAWTTEKETQCKSNPTWFSKAAARRRPSSTQGARCRGDDAHALEGQPRSPNVPARCRGESDAHELPHRRYNFAGVRWAVHGAAEL